MQDLTIYSPSFAAEMETRSAADTNRALSKSVPASWRSGANVREKVDGDYNLVGFIADAAPPRDRKFEEAFGAANNMAGYDFVVKHVTMLLATLPASPDRKEEISASILVDAIARELRYFATDIVLTAIRDWQLTQKFWPTVADLLILCNRYAGPRADMARIIAMSKNRHSDEMPREINSQERANAANFFGELSKALAEGRSREFAAETERKHGRSRVRPDWLYEANGR